METAKAWIKKLLFPPGWVTCLLPPASFAVLIYVFLSEKQDTPLAYATYFFSAYGLTIWCVGAPRLYKHLKHEVAHNETIQTVTAHPLVILYRRSPAFKAWVSIAIGLVINLLYTVFRLGMGLYYLSPWFISMGLYYLGLGILRLNLLKGFRNRLEGGLAYEYRCYARTARHLFLLNIPMGGMILLMVFTDYGYNYPGVVIYVSAVHAFYMVITAFIRLGKNRELESPILMAASVLKCIEAMMSLLGLQTALITQFSENGKAFGQTMNAISGGVIYAMVIGAAVYMLIHARKKRKELPDEPDGGDGRRSE